VKEEEDTTVTMAEDETTAVEAPKPDETTISERPTSAESTTATDSMEIEANNLDNGDGFTETNGASTQPETEEIGRPGELGWVDIDDQQNEEENTEETTATAPSWQQTSTEVVALGKPQRQQFLETLDAEFGNKSSRLAQQIFDGDANTYRKCSNRPALPIVRPPRRVIEK
jgi:hypothetical protein